MRRLLTALTLTLALAAGLSLHAQLPGPPVGAPQANQNVAHAYNFEYTYQMGATNSSGFRVLPTLNLTTATSYTTELMRVGGTMVLPNSSTSATTLAALRVQIPVYTLNSGTVTNAIGLMLDGDPVTGTNKFAFWNKGSTLLGVAGTTAGTIGFQNATSGTITLAPVTGALGTVTLSLPAATDTLVGKATTDSLSNKSFPTAGVGFTNATSGTITVAAPTGALATPTLTLPAFVSGGGLPVALDCGSTGSGNQTCAPTAVTGLTKIIAGHSTLSSNAAVITLPASSAFTGTATYDCVGNDVTTRANPVQVVQTSASTFTITNTTGASDVIEWICVGN